MFESLREKVGLTKHNHPIDKLTEAASLLGGIALFPQAFKIFVTHHVSDIEPSTFLIMVLTNSVWTAYGVHRKSLPLLISGILNFIAAALILSMYLVFKNAA